MNPHLPPTVCLDGTAVRLIREEKKLTQLYVAKVVGVTTDTISRWENNRYPSIKRENALRLAEALETSVENILQGETGECSLSPESESKRRSPSRRFIILVLILLLSVAALAFLALLRNENPASSIRAERVLPRYAAPGSVIPVRIRLQADADLKGFIIREHFPPGWKLIEASPPASSLDNEEGTVRWMIKPEEPRPVISYLLKVAPRSEPGTVASFSGEIVAGSNGRQTPSTVFGLDRIEVAPLQWADQNGDKRIDDAEMLEASDALDEMKGVHIEWRQLEALWDAGSYRWDPNTERFVPVRESGLQGPP